MKLSEPLKSTSSISEPEEENSSDHSVLDFLYHDSRRVGSFLSQFESVGFLQQLTQNKDVKRSKSDTSEKGIKGSAGVASGNYKGISGTSADLSEGYSRVFDPHWSNARAFLNYANERGLIQTDIITANMGQFVLFKGAMIITDLQMMQNVWGLDSVKRQVKAAIDGNADNKSVASAVTNRSAKAKREIAAKQPPSEMELVLEVLPHLPHSSQFHVISDTTAVWATIEPDAMVGKISDLILKHGAKIAGEWSMLGILDGRPWEIGDHLTSLEMILATGGDGTVSKLPLELAPQIRRMLGRPLLSYAMTPLLVFRTVA